MKTTGNAAVISPGTGLGEAGLYWDGVKHCPFASEGGHAEFGPRNELEIELVNYLEDRLDRVSYESVLSGPGLVNIYKFLRDTHYNDRCETLETRCSSQILRPVFLRRPCRERPPSVIRRSRCFSKSTELKLEI